MTVIEKISAVNEIIKELLNFTQTDKTVRADFDEYLATLGSRRLSLAQMEKVFLPYIFERRINDKSILEIFKESGCKNEDILNGLLKSVSSIFLIKRILKNGFELYNMVNEKTYTALSLTKMTSFRGVYSGQYIAARIFEFEGDYYIVEISSVLSHSQKQDAMRYAIMKLIQNPRLLYLDNPEKEEMIKKTISEMYDKFIKTFGKDIILTTNKYADEIIGAFNEGEDVDLTGKESVLEHPMFFHIKELDNNYNNFLENSIGGFSSHQEIYDVAVIFDKNAGLYALPFYETFTKIFENKDNVENAKGCLEYFLTNDSIPKLILDRVSSQYSNFMEVVNELMGTDINYEELIKKYKSDYVDNTIYSSATVLYCSGAFSDVFDVMSTPEPEQPALPDRKIGRNEPCPCGSGKKYKNCCMKLAQQ